MVSSSMLSSLVFEGIRCGKVINEEKVTSIDDLGARELYKDDPNSLFQAVPQNPDQPVANTVSSTSELGGQTGRVGQSAFGNGNARQSSDQEYNRNLYGVIEDKGNGISYHINKTKVSGQIVATAGATSAGYFTSIIMDKLLSGEYKPVEPYVADGAERIKPLMTELEPVKQELGQNDQAWPIVWGWIVKTATFLGIGFVIGTLYSGTIRALEAMGDIPYLGRATVWLAFIMGGNRLVEEDENGKLIDHDIVDEDDQRVWVDYLADLRPYPDPQAKDGLVLHYDKTFNYWYPLYRYNYDKGTYFSQLEIALATNYEVKVVDTPREREVIKDEYDMLTLVKLNKRSKVVINNAVSKNNYAVYATWSQYPKLPKGSSILYDEVPHVNGVQTEIMGGFLRDDSAMIFNFCKVLDDGVKTWYHRVVAYDGNLPLVNLDQVDMSMRIPCA